MDAATTFSVTSTTEAATIASVTDSTETASLTETLTFAASSTLSASTSGAEATTTAAADVTLTTSLADSLSTSLASTDSASTAAASTSAASSTSFESSVAVSTSVATTTADVSTSTTSAQSTTAATSTTALDTTTQASFTSTVSESTSASSTSISTLSTSVAASTADASTSLSAILTTSSASSVATSASTLTSSLSVALGTTVTGSTVVTATSGQITPPAPGAVTPAPAQAFYYNASLFLIQTPEQSGSAGRSANFLPLVLRDLAVVVLQAPGSELYVQPAACAYSNCCAQASVQTCCSSAAAPGCIAATQSVTRCLDASTPLAGSAPFGSSIYYEIGIAAACQNVMIDLSVTSGDADLYVRANALPDALYERVPFTATAAGQPFDWSSTNYGSDSIYFCCNAEDGNLPTPYPGVTAGSVDSYYRRSRRSLASLLANGTARLYVQVVSWSASARWTIKLLQATPADPAPLFSLATHPWLLTQTRLSCENSVDCYIASDGNTNPSPCMLLALPSLDPTDPYYAWAHRASDGSGFAESELLPDQIAFILFLSETAAGQQVPPVQLSNCSLRAPGILNASGISIFNQNPIPVTPASALTCDPEAFVNVSSGFAKFADAQAAIPSLEQRSDVVQGVGAVVTSRIWQSCDLWVRTELLNSSLVTSKRELTTECTAERGTAEYLNDPCCNPLLLLQQCCAPRPRSVAYAANLAAIGAKCRASDCSVEAAEQLARYLEVQADPSVGCDAQALSSTRLFQSNNPLAVPNGACAHYLTWAPSDPTPYDPALTECVLDALTASPFLLRAFAAQLFSLSAGAYASEAEFNAAFADQFRARYAAQPLCQQGGAPFNVYGTQLRNTTLDGSASLCASTPVCNWGLGRTNASCGGQGYRGASFCGYCTDGWCHEISDPAGCRIVKDNYGGNLAAHCATIGGVLMTEEEGGSECFLPNATTQAQCFAATECRVVLTASQPPVTTCALGCAIAAFNASTCGCIPLPADRTLARECNYLKWDNDTGRCWHDGIANAPDCVARGGVLFGGREWHAGFIDTPAKCAAVAGVCLDNVALNQTQCTGECDELCFGCNSTQCAAAAGCSDVLAMPPFGACLSAPTLSLLGLAPQCPSSAELTPLGCADYFTSQSVCLAANRTWYQPVGASPFGNCSDAKGCKQLSNGFTLDNSFRPPDECVACGGEPYTLFEQVNATYTAYRWQPLSWIQRNFSNIARYGPAFNTIAFLNDLQTVTGALEFGSLKSELLCLYSQPERIIAELTCDCIAGGGRGCYSSSGSFVGVYRACNGIAGNFTNLGVSLFVPATVSFSDGCSEIAIYRIAAQSFKRPRSLRSSLFLGSLAKGPYVIVRNSRGAEVGQLMGDGVQLVMSDAVGVRLCLPLADWSDSRERSFRVPDFATATSSFRFDSFRLLQLSSAYFDNDTNSICATLAPPLSGYYFPVYRAANPSAPFFKALSRGQRGAFYAALVIYLIVAVVAYARFANAVAFSLAVERQIILVLIWFMVALFLTLRWVYYVLVIRSRITEGTAGDYVLSELPTPVFFTLFSLIVLFWATLYHSVTRIKGDLRRPVYIVCIVANVVLYTFFVAAIAVYVRSSGSASTAVCGRTSVSSTASALAKAYKIVLFAMVLALGVAFIVYGWQLGRLLNTMKRKESSTAKFRKFMTIAILFPIALVLQCILLLVGAFGGAVNTGAALFLLLLVEIVPLAVLVWAMAQPKVFDTPLKDCMWFMYYKEISSVGSSSQTGTDSNKQVVSVQQSMVESRNESYGL